MPKRFRRFWFGAILVPPSLWALLLTFAPTDWARIRVVEALSDATGQPVRLERLRLGFFGGVGLAGLEIGQPGGARDASGASGPWLRAEEVHLDLSCLQLLAGRIEPTRCRISRVSLRVHRRADGSFEFGDLLRAERKPSGRSGPGSGRDDPSPTFAVELAESRVMILDEPSGTRLDLTAVDAVGTWGPEAAEVDQLTASVGGGRLELAARLERGARPTFEGEARIQHASLDGGNGLLAYLVPALSTDSTEGLPGRLDLNVKLRGQGATSDEIRRSLSGQGKVWLQEAPLDNSKLMSTLAGAFRAPARGRLGSIRGDFVIADRRVLSRNLTLQVGSLPVVMAGWTDFDGRVDYAVRTEGLPGRLSAIAGRLPPEARSSLEELPTILDRVARLRIQGTTDDLVLTIDGVPLEEWAGRTGHPNHEEVGRLRELGRRIKGLDRILR